MSNNVFWKIEWNPSRQIIAGSVGIWTLDIYPAEDLKSGDVIRFNPDFLRAKWDVGEFFFTTAADCAIEHRRVYPYITSRGVSFDSFMEGEITAGCIKAGELVRLYMGNYSQCGKDCIAPKLAVKNASANLLFRSKEKDVFRIVSEISYDVLPAETNRLSAHFLSPTAEKSDICVSAIDEFGNITDCANNVVLFFVGNCGEKNKLASVALECGKARINDFEMPDIDGPVWLYAELEDNENIVSEKAPFFPGFMKNNGRNIFFGEMHLHSAGSHNDGMNQPEFVYDYAQYVSGMAFCGITDHVGMIKDDFWQRQREIAKEYYKPGSFVPILGYEWDSDCQRGHTCVFVKGDLQKIIKGDSIEEVWAKLEAEGYEFFTRPNHVNTVAEHLPLLPLEELKAWKNYDWSQHDDKRQPLVELVNPRGSSENEEIGDGVLREGHGSSVDSALKAGHRIGFCGGSDDHTGRPGATPFQNWIIKKEDLHSGATAVLSEKLDMDSVWSALVNRSTYATTGAKILLDVQVDDMIMGCQKRVEDQKEAVIKVRVIGTDQISNVAIIRNGDVIKEYQPDSIFFESSFVDTEIPFDIPCRKGDGAHAYYYVRITQCDGHRAWGSPIFYSV